MSRVAPKQFNRGNSVQNPLWAWYTINSNNRSIGTVWLEKEDLNSKTATLGILLDSIESFNQGIGRQAVSFAIETSSNTLGLKTVLLNVRKSNKRAIACYKKCGFSIAYEDTKLNGEKERISFYTMQLEPEF